MTVFKGYLKGALRQKAVILLYLVIFLGLGTMMTMSLDKQQEYEDQKLSMTVIDRDKSPVSRGLQEYLSSTQEVVELPDEKDVWKEELYYGNIQYVLIIPEGFEEKLLAEQEEELLEGTGRPGSVQSHYASQLAESYLSGIQLYLQWGDSPEEAVSRMAQIENKDTKADFKDGSSPMSRVAGTLQYLPYVLTALSCYVIGFVMLEYSRPEIRKRLAVSAVSSLSRTCQLLLAVLVIGLAFFGVSILLVALMNPSTVLQEPHRLWYLGNMGAMVAVGLSIGIFVVQIASSPNAVNGFANVIALGMSFLCGVFIPKALLSPSVNKVAAYLPVYWYEENNSILGTHTILSVNLSEKLLHGIEVQLIFAAGILAVALVIRKIRERK